MGVVKATVARSPSGKARVCKTLIGGSIPPRASKNSGPLPRSRAGGQPLLESRSRRQFR